MFSLEHFYYGQLVHHGSPTGDMRVLARSGGITDDHVAVAVRVALLAPHPGIPEGTWGIVRSENKEFPYLLAQTQKGSFGQTTHHIIPLTLEVVRTIAGNLKVILPLLQPKLPVYEMLGDKLPALTLPKPAPQSVSLQADDLLDLMTYTHNNTRNIEPLLSAVVRGTLLIILGAPAATAERTAFIQGLLTLLPSSTRYNTTFVTHSAGAANVKTRIAFMEALVDAVPDEAVIYHWQDAKIEGAESKDDYSRFIVGQLRLDAEMAVEQAEMLTPTAGWRFRNGDNLADALAYASKRVRIDQAIDANQPVEVAEAAKILGEDPTLDDERRGIYARHLMRMALALDDTAHTESVAVTLTRLPELANEIHRQMSDAVKDGKGALIFETLRHWLDNPLSPQGPQWVTLVQQSALAELDELITARDMEGIGLWLDDVMALDMTLGVARITPRIMTALLPLAANDSALPGKLVLLALKYLDKAEAQKLLAQPNFARYLARDLKRFIAALSKDDVKSYARIFVEAVNSLDESGRDLAAIILADMAIAAERYELLDTAALALLVKAAASPDGRNQSETVLRVAQRMESAGLMLLNEEGGRYLLQLFLAGGRYDLLAKSMLEQARVVYGVERQQEYIRMVQKLFAEMPISTPTGLAVLHMLEGAGIGGIPLKAAGCGILEGTGFSPDMNAVAARIVSQLEADPDLLEVIPPEMPYALLSYAHAQNDEAGIRQAARFVPINAAFQADDRHGLSIISQSYKLLRGEKTHARLGFDIIRHYIRLAPDKPAARVVSYYSKELGGEAAERLDVAYRFSAFMGRVDFVLYAELLHQTTDLLYTAAEAYSKRDKPTLKQLQMVANNLRIRMEEKIRRQFARDLQQVAKLLVMMGKVHESGTASGSKYVDGLLKGTEAPRTSVDVWRSMGGYIAHGRVIGLKFNPGDAPSPFGNTPPDLLRAQTAAAISVLGSAYKITPAGKWSAEIFTADLDNIIASLTLSTEEARELRRQVAIDAQRLGELIPLIYKDGDASVLEDENRLGKRIDAQQHEPRNVLEMLRFFFGYFLVK